MIDANLPIDTFVAARRLLAQARGRHNPMTPAATHPSPPYPDKE
jgi:hypothetical protein